MNHKKEKAITQNNCNQIWALPIHLTSTLNWTVQEPRPPDLVVTMTSPYWGTLTAPHLAIILLGECHSAYVKHSMPHIVRPKQIIQRGTTEELCMVCNMTEWDNSQTKVQK